MVSQLPGAEFVQHKGRVVIAKNAAFLPFHLPPGRIPQSDIEATALGVNVRKGQFPVEEAEMLT
ncbi:hypothetical protein D3C81_1823380 [compost metagenome]